MDQVSTPYVSNLVIFCFNPFDVFGFPVVYSVFLVKIITWLLTSTPYHPSYPSHPCINTAPFAKLQTQRNRRISSPENSLITPGTDFMNAMDDVILCYVLQRVKRPLFQVIDDTQYMLGDV
jgi:hypothetical protein